MSENLNADSSHEANEEAQKWESLTKLKFDPKEASRVEVKSAGNVFGEGRDDRSVSVASPEGEFHRSSSIMFGKTEKGENFANARYISADDIRAQIDAQIAESEGAQLVDTSYEPPRPVTTEEAMAGISEKVKEGSDAINLSEMSVNNASAKRIEVVDAEGETKANSVLIYNKEVEISDGEYLSEKGVKEALKTYMIGTEAPAKSVAVKEPVDRSFKFSKKIAAVALAALLFFSFTGDKGADAKDGVPIGSTNDSVVELVSDIVDQVEVDKQGSGIKIGDKYYISDGVEAHRSSDYQYGGEDGAISLDDGEYDIQGFSVQNPKTHEIKESTWEDGTDLDEFVEKEAEEMGVSPEELEPGVKIHVGKNDTPGQGQLGWVDSEDVVNNGGGVNE